MLTQELLFGFKSNFFEDVDVYELVNMISYSYVMILIGISISINTFAHIFYIGLSNPYFSKSLLLNSSLIYLMIFINCGLDYMGRLDQIDYTIINYLIDIPMLHIIIGNIIMTKNHNLDELNEESLENNHNQDDIQEDNLCEEKTDYVDEEQYQKLNEVIAEKYNEYINSIIFEYENRIDIMKNNYRLTPEEMVQIDNIVGDKLTSRDVRLLIRTINLIYQQKLQCQN